MQRGRGQATGFCKTGLRRWQRLRESQCHRLQAQWVWSCHLGHQTGLARIILAAIDPHLAKCNNINTSKSKIFSMYVNQISSKYLHVPVCMYTQTNQMYVCTAVLTSSFRVLDCWETVSVTVTAATSVTGLRSCNRNCESQWHNKWVPGPVFIYSYASYLCLPQVPLRLHFSRRRCTFLTFIHFTPQEPHIMISSPAVLSSSGCLNRALALAL